MEHRQYPRLPIDSLEVDISDGKGFFCGTIDNISRSGLSVSGLPSHLDGKAEILTAIVNGQGESFKMFLKPKWEYEEKKRKSVGLEIESSSWGWAEFVMKFEADRDDEQQISVH